MKRVFFDWNLPFLPSVAKRIVSAGIASSKGGELDLGKYVYILPGRRAIRTLESYVQDEIASAQESGQIGLNWRPPRYATLGTVPEQLYRCEHQIANPLTRLYAMRQAAEEYFTNKTPESESLLPRFPQTFGAQLELANTFLRLKDELDSERKRYRDVADYCARLDLPEEVERWNALEKLNALYFKTLKSGGMTDLNNARMEGLRAIGDPASDTIDGEPREYRVVGAVDLNRLQKSVFEKLGNRVEFWVFAPESEADAFDDFGCVDPDVWGEYELPLNDAQLFQVKSPVEQGKAVELLVRELSKRYDADGNWEYERLDPYSLTVGVPDEEVVPFIERELQALDYITIVGEGTPISRHHIFQLLSNLADYLETRSFASFDELLRRLDLGEYLRRHWDEAYAEGLQESEAQEEEERLAQEEADEEQRRIAVDMDAFGNEDEEAVENDAPAFDDAPKDATEARENENRDWLIDLDAYYAQFLPTRVNGYWFRHVDEDNEKRSRAYLSLRKASFLLNEKLLHATGFWTTSKGRAALSRSQVVVNETEGNLADLKIQKDDLDPFAGECAFMKGMFDEKTRWETNQVKRPLNKWSEPLSKLLTSIFPTAEKHIPNPSIDGFFKRFNNALYALSEIPTALASEATGSEAIRVVLKSIAQDRIAPEPQEDPIELQGALDLLFDDAPDVILTGFNEGTIPTNRSSDLFLPNETRSKVGLNDSKRAFARDAYLTTALAHSRRNLLIVFERTSLQGDPKIPSRFVFATNKTQIPFRVVKFFAESDSGDLARLEARQLGPDGKKRAYPRPVKTQTDDAGVNIADTADPETDAEYVSQSGDPELDALNRRAEKIWTESQRQSELGFHVPELDIPGRLLDESQNGARESNSLSLNVTDFEKFLDSPYRYFLQKTFKLNSSTISDFCELDAGKFGDLTHNVLRAFGSGKVHAEDEDKGSARKEDAGDVRESTDWYKIYAWLSKELDDQAKTFTNEHTSPFVRIQIEQIRSRLSGFAKWQAKWRELGNKIKWVEKGPKAGGIELCVGNNKAWVSGRIDRIDCSADGKTWFVFDYKTFDSYQKGKREKGEERQDWAGSDDDLGLLSTIVGNTTDSKHREPNASNLPLPIQFLHELGIEPEKAEQNRSGDVGNNNDETTKNDQGSRWINLQLPLYRRLVLQILSEAKELSVQTLEEQIERKELNLRFAYIVLPKNAEVCALGAPWGPEQFREADATASWVIRAIKRLSLAPLKPNALIDPELGFKERVLENSKLKFEDKFASVTLSYAADL